MSKILKRPMFRKGGPAMTGIMSGIKPRQNYKLGEDVQAYRDEFTEAYGSVPSGGAFDPLTQLLIGFGQKAMTTPSSGNALRDLVEASKDPSKQFFKAKSKEAADKRNIQLAATKFGLTEAGKDRRQQKAIDFQREKLGNLDNAKIEARTETYFDTYRDQKKAENHAKYDFGIQEQMIEKFGSDQVAIGLNKKDIEKKAGRAENVGKAFFNIEEGNITQVLPNGEVVTFSLAEMTTDPDIKKFSKKELKDAKPAFTGADSKNPTYRQKPKDNFFKTLEPVDPFDTDVSVGA